MFKAVIRIIHVDGIVMKDAVISVTHDHFNITNTTCDDRAKQANGQSIYVLTGHLSGHF